MSGLYGTTQAYQPISSYYLNLAPSCDDNIFGTNINYCKLVNWGIYDGQEKDPFVLNLYTKDKSSCNASICKEENIDNNNEDIEQMTIWSLLQSLPQCKKWSKIIKRSGFYDYINQTNQNFKTTMFVPIDNAIPEEWMMYLNNVNNNSLRPLCLAHTLPFAFEQSSAYGRKLRLYTSLDTFSVYIDGTGEVLNELNFYIPPTEMLLFQYPQPLKRIKIIQGYYTTNGAMYLIDGIFSPSVVI